MIDDLLKKLLKLINSPIVTPYNLLQNMELENYTSINYYKNGDNILADVKFLVYKEEITFRYVFDYDNYLQKIYHVNGSSLELQFDREQEKNTLIQDINNNNYIKNCG